MNDLARADALFHSVLSRFFLIPARERMMHGISSAQMRVLWTLGQMERGTPARVAGILGISRPSVTELAARLEEAGYLRRIRSTTDRREVLLVPRARGRKLLEEYARRRRQRMRTVVGALGPRDRSRLVASLETLDRLMPHQPEPTR